MPRVPLGDAVPKCPVCFDPLHTYYRHKDPALLTYINGAAVHSGHCESEVLRTSSKKVRITAVSRPMDLRDKYGV